jgi:hypothetical protein
MRLVKKELEDDTECEPETIDGVEVTLKMFYADRKSTRHEVRLDGYNFACEIEHTPWSIFEPITVNYWVWLDLPLSAVERLLASVRDPEGAVSPMAEFYPTESAPRWNACVSELGDVLKLWKLWEPKYRPK